MFHRLDLVCRGVDSFDGLKDATDCNFVVVNVQGNRICDFDGFGTHPYMIQLDAKGNSIKSFYGLTRQRSLQSLELRGNPVATHPFYRIMALMVAGFSLTVIDGSPITPEERTLARRAGSDAAMAVSFGWLLDMKPRTPEAFRALISEGKRIHNARKVALAASNAHSRKGKSVTDALQELGGGGGGVSFGRTDDQARRLAQITAEAQDADSRRTIERLATRVAALEQMMQEASASAAAASTAQLLQHRSHDQLLHEYSKRAVEGQMVPFGGAQSESSLTGLDVQGASVIMFTTGIATRTNQGPSSQSARRSCLQLSRRAVTVLNFMTRSPTFELKLSGSVMVSYRRPKTLVLENRFGVALAIEFEDFDVLRTVFKLLFLLRSKPVPPLPSFHDTDAGDGGSSGGTGMPGIRNSHDAGSAESEDEEPEDAKAAPASAVMARARTSPRAWIAPASGSHSMAVAAEEQTARREEQKGVAEVDNIPDIPPLPSSGGQSTAAHADAAAAKNDGSAPASEISFRFDEPGNQGNTEGAEVATMDGATVPAPPARPAPYVPSQRFQNLLIASSDSDSAEGGMAPPAPVRAASKTPPLPPGAPPRQRVSGPQQPAPESTVGTREAPSVIPVHSPAGSSINFAAERKSAAAQSTYTGKDTPMPSARSSVAGAGQSVAGSGREAAQAPSSVEARAAPTPPPVAGRFASLMIDSDSD